MGVTNYTVIDGEIVSENRNGVQSDYIPDSLGSTVALVNSSHQSTDTYTYWPYGELRSHVGSSVTPYTYCGTIGYRSDSIGYYVRARELKAIQTRWLTVDPLWPYVYAFNYVASNSTSLIDPSGLDIQRDFWSCYQTMVSKFPDRTKQGVCGACKSLYNAHVDCGSQCFASKGGSSASSLPGFSSLQDAAIGSIIPYAGEGLVSRFEIQGCLSTCSLSVRIMVDEVNSKYLRKTCVAACNALAQGGCTALFIRCNAMGNSVQGKNCMTFYAFNCSGK